MKKNILFLLMLSSFSLSIITSEVEMDTGLDEVDEEQLEEEKEQKEQQENQDDIDYQENKGTGSSTSTDDPSGDTGTGSGTGDTGSNKAGVGSSGAQSTGSLSLATDSPPVAEAVPVSAEEAANYPTAEAVPVVDGDDIEVIDDDEEEDVDGDDSSDPSANDSIEDSDQIESATTVEELATAVSDNPTAAEGELVVDAMIDIVEDDSATFDVDENEESSSPKRKSFLQILADFFNAIGLSKIATKIENWSRTLESNARIKQIYASVPSVSSTQQDAISKNNFDINSSLADQARNILGVDANATRAEVEDAYNELTERKYSDPLIDNSYNSQLDKVIAQVSMTNSLYTADAITEYVDATYQELLDSYPSQEEIDAQYAEESGQIDNQPWTLNFNDSSGLETAQV